jgi:hypothetical protein
MMSLTPGELFPSKVNKLQNIAAEVGQQTRSQTFSRIRDQMGVFPNTRGSRHIISLGRRRKAGIELGFTIGIRVASILIASISFLSTDSWNGCQCCQCCQWTGVFGKVQHLPPGQPTGSDGFWDN